ncbi:MAG: Phosphate ABC transporter membrane protein 2, PhoT family [Desulfotomaculum sp. 46_296]|nr:MAG: Phosphate ABC transporter membrane protein 2, PhoT family [Desulfotomaculum sp. 46_296]HAU31569.1 phosphate ABC transporter permease PtsA [Desulfotomaculum sp.]
MIISPKTAQKIAWLLTWLSGLIVLLILTILIGFIFYHGLSAISWSFINNSIPEGGIFSAIVCTLYIVLLTLALAVPLGLGTAIYLSLYAPKGRFSEFVRYGIETLAGVPSIIFGLFGMALFVIVLLGTQCLLAGALTMACLVLPTMILASEEAIRAVPPFHMEASLALGATKWQTITKVILPTALPGIITAVILCVGRVIGETACLYATLGLSMLTPGSLFHGGRTLALHLYLLVTEMPGDRELLIRQAMGTSIILIIIIILINLLTRLFSGYFLARMKGDN